MAKGKASQASQALPSALSNPWTFLRPTNDLHNLVADSAKRILDSLAASVVEEQSARRQANKKRKRSETGLDAHPPLQLKTLYVDGFTSNQIWEQAIRILDSAGSEVERDIALLAEHDVYQFSGDEEHSELLGVSDPENTGSESDDADSISNVSSENASGDDLNEELDNGSDSLDQEDLEAMSQIDEEMSDEEASMHSTEEDPGTYVEDRFGLNDGFFSIDEFNKQSEQLERQDAKGGADDDDDDDSDEEVDWHANPLLGGSAMPIAKKDAPSKERRPDNDDDMDDSSEEDGPTFGNVDLKAGFDSDEDDEDASHAGDADATGWIDTSDIKYADFFAPPPRKASSKKARALPKTQPAKPIMDEDVDRAMADVRRDLFDESEEEEEEEGGDGLDVSGDAPNQRSTHEKQRARIADEIRRLEAANVAKKTGRSPVKLERSRGLSTL
jgi:U3 small nucleolar ribonucleoprotein component